MKKLNIIIYILLASSFFACKQKSISSNSIVNENEELIQISRKQFNSEKMEIGSITSHSFEDIISCNGSVTAPPNGIANISTPISGIVKSISFTSGNYVKKGQVLCQIESNELIVIQQDYAETSALLRSAKADYERNKALFNEKIGAEKDLFSSESKFKATKAKYESLKLKLQILHLNTNKIKEGKFESSLSISAPINGYITNYKLVLGQFMEQQQSLVEIIDPTQLQIKISVFEKDIHQLKLGQKLHFKTLSNPNESFLATMSSIGKGIDPQTKSILCLAKIEEEDKGKLYKGSFIEAQIITNKKNANALPNKAIVKSGSDHFIFVVDKNDQLNYYLRKEKINIGSQTEEFSEILNPQKITKVLINGVYNISAD